MNKVPLEITQVFKDYYLGVYGIAFSATIDPESAKDLVSLTFFKLLTHRGHFSNPRDLKHFLYLTIRAESLAFVRNREIQLAAQEEIAWFISQETSQTPEEDSQQELVDRLYMYIKRLPPKRRKVCELFLSGKKTSEIAEFLGISNKTVLAHKRNAIVRLRQFFTGKSAKF